MFSADADLEPGFGGPAALNGNLHQLANALLIQDLKGSLSRIFSSM